MSEPLQRIASFTVDHTKLRPGLYLSRVDGDIVTFDLRFKRPNTGDLLTNSELHSAEHLIATLLRNSPEKDAVIYFGPMGCQTGFYFLFDSRRLSNMEAIELLKRVFAAAGTFTGEMPGKSVEECGNYVNLDVETGRTICQWYADLIADWDVEKLRYE
ncbi:MAG: S-ribosylhomocysteine lyase [Oscillibacter sp.]|nr:S-ribosylhomocysteine lyase [Oscillibacter sp.]